MTSVGYSRWIVVAIVGLALAGAVRAGIVNNSTISILNTSSTAFPSYDQIFALDTAPNTDYASQGFGAATHLDMDFGTAQTFQSIAYTDRVTSGGNNGGFVGGTFDFVTSFEYVFATDALFSNIVGSVTVSGLVAPVGATSAAQFLTTTSIPGITAEFVRWRVLTTNGVNPGASNFAFTVGATATPEPGSLALFGAGFAALCLFRRRLRVS
jgi:PEP-CTERM motif